ncbi:NUDIX domain-containing protein [Polaromonas sp.]|nr:NUDIX domain-containing protein [Candidatus Saccharibacteria bacterium]
MSNPEVVQTVRLIAFDAWGRVIICKRKMDAKQRAGQWEFPGGKVDNGEGTVEAVIREFTEETGVMLDEKLVDARPVYNRYDYDKGVGKWYSRDFFKYGGRLAADQLYVPREADAIVAVTLDEALNRFVNIPHQRAASRIPVALVA